MRVSWLGTLALAFAACAAAVARVEATSIALSGLSHWTDRYGYGRRLPTFIGLSDAEPNPFDRPSSRAAAALLPVRSAELPEDPVGAGRERLIVTSGWRPGLLSAEQGRALASWTAWGGVLVLSREDGYAAGSSSWLRPLLPGAPPPAASPPWEASRAGDADLSLTAPTLGGAPGSEVVILIGSEPIASCRRHGLGAVCLLAFDAADPRAYGGGGWESLMLGLWRSYGPGPSLEQEPAVGERRALERALEKATRPRSNPGGVLLAFSAAYACSIAWFAWFRLRRRGREELAWAGVLGCALLFGLAALGLGRLVAGRASTVRFYVVHGVPGSSDARIRGWVARFSTTDAPWTTELPLGADRVEDLGSWKPVPLKRSEGPAVLSAASEAGQSSLFAVSGLRRLPGDMRLELRHRDSRSYLAWENRTGLEFELVWSVGAPPGSGGRARNGSSGGVPVGDGSLRAAEGWTDEELQVANAYLLREKSRCPGCVFLAGIRADDGSQGFKALHLWSVAAEAKAGARFYQGAVLDQ